MQTTNYYNDYQVKRNTCLSLNQFTSMLMMYPSILVAIADGEFDALEKQNLAESLKQAAESNTLIACEMYSELSYLMKANDEVKEDLLINIKNEISNKADIKSLILELMTSMAESSEGISDIELKTISTLKSKLSI
jgi:hypothetical protein